MGLRIVVDRDLCESNAVCVRLAHDVFVIDDADKLQLLVEHPPEGRLDKVNEAIRKCPRRALRLEET